MQERHTLLQLFTPPIIHEHCLGEPRGPQPGSLIGPYPNQVISYDFRESLSCYGLIPVTHPPGHNHFIELKAARRTTFMYTQ